MISNKDKKLIEELGWQHLTEEQQAGQLDMFYGALQIKIGLALEHELNDRQLAEFEKVNAKGDDTVTTAWLKQAVPNYDKVAIKELSALKHDLKRTSAEFKKVINEAGN